MVEHRGESFVMGSGDEANEAISFSTFIMGLASSALIHLGDAPNPETGKPDVQLELAKQSLDLLAILHTKTQGNLTSDEETLFRSLLTDLRMRFVQKSST